MTRDGCPAAEELAAFASRERSSTEQRELELHLDSCADCRAALGALFPTELSPTDPAARAPLSDGEEVPLAPGTPIGRFIVGALIGAGGMGIVYAARDTELNRDVAIKLLRRRRGDEGLAMLEARMRREGQAMARLSHPNVIPVFEVGAYDGRLFVAMELVEGGTLREWLMREKRSTQEIVDVFVKAGHGLAAAHSAGLVHRDFKPDNVLVGKDGRVRVTDFGLARFAGATGDSGADGAAVAASGTGAGSGSDSITRTGAVLGTPAYMSPEHLTGVTADARTDQYSFCVALYEALAGVRPFPFPALQRPLAGPPPRAKPDGIDRIPRWLRKPLARGLSPLPAARYADMTSLLRELHPRAPSLRRRWLVVGACVLVAVLAVGREQRARVLECQVIGQRARSAWGDVEREAVERAFVATGRPYAEDAFRRTAAALDAYTAKWSTLAVESCRAGRETKGDLATARAACFDARLGDLRALIGLLGRADGETMDRAVRSARALSSIDTCTGADPLEGEPVPGDPRVRDEVRALEQDLSQATALRAAGRFAESVAASTKSVADADRIAFPPLQARALLVLARAEEDSGDPTVAEHTYHRASLAAEQAAMWATAAGAFMGEAWCAANRGDYERADERFDHAGVWVNRAKEDGSLRGRLLLLRGRALVDQGKYDEARALDASALALFERAGSDDAFEAINELGITADYQGRYEEARDDYQRALERYERVLGPDSLKVAAELSNLGLLESDHDHPDVAIRDLSRALSIEEAARGRDHPSTAQTMTNLALALNTADRSAEALPLALRAVPLAEKGTGPDTPDVAFALGALYASYMGLHRYEEAIAPAERELAIFSPNGVPLNVADATANVGFALFESGRDRVRGRKLLVEARSALIAVGRSERARLIDDLIGKDGGT